MANWLIDIAIPGATWLTWLKMFSPPISRVLRHLNMFENPTFFWLSWLKPSSLLCFAGFVELNHMLTSCYPPLSANSTSGPLRLLQKQRRERERWPSQGHLLLDVLKLWNSERICTSLVSPRTFFFCTHIHTSFPHKTLLEWQLPFLDHKKLLLEQWGKRVKETISNLLTMTNPTELLKGIWMSKVQQEQNFLKTE